MNKKQILCTGLSFALLLSSVVTTPASIAAGKYFKIQYTHSKKKIKKKAINARYNNKVISTKIPGYIEGSTSMYSCILDLRSLFFSWNKIFIFKFQKKSYITTKFSETCDDFKQQNSYLEWEEIHPSICTSKNPLYRKKEKLYHGSRRYRCKKTRLKLFMEQSSVIRSDLKGQYC